MTRRCQLHGMEMCQSVVQSYVESGRSPAHDNTVPRTRLPSGDTWFSTNDIIKLSYLMTLSLCNVALKVIDRTAVPVLKVILCPHTVVVFTQSTTFSTSDTCPWLSTTSFQTTLASRKPQRSFVCEHVCANNICLPANDTVAMFVAPLPGHIQHVNGQRQSLTISHLSNC